MAGSLVGKSSLYVDDSRCHACRRCLAQQICKVKAIVRIDGGEPPFIDVHRCHGCLICSLECPFNAIVAA